MRVTDNKYAKNIHYYSENCPEGIIKILKNNKIKSTLDLGCGDGALLYALKIQGLLNSKKVYAVDISPERIDRVKQIDKNFICLVADACKLPAKMKIEKLDFIISSQLIEHVENQNQLIQEMKDVLMPGGYLYLGTVFKKKYAWYYHYNKGNWVLDPTHLREYTDEKQLTKLLEKSDLNIIQNSKTLYWFPLTDFFLKRLCSDRKIYNSKIFNLLRKIKIPIIGYYNWELICQKK